MDLAGIDQVIAGGESGSGAREMPAVAALELHRQCQLQNVAFFFKQTGVILAKKLALKDKKGGKFDELPAAFRIREFPEKSAYGDLLASP